MFRFVCGYEISHGRMPWTISCITFGDLVPMKMMANIPAELNRFCTCSKRLRTILTDTKRCFDDINEDGKQEVGECWTYFHFSCIKFFKTEMFQKLAVLSFLTNFFCWNSWYMKHANTLLIRFYRNKYSVHCILYLIKHWFQCPLFFKILKVSNYK